MEEGGDDAETAPPSAFVESASSPGEHCRAMIVAALAPLLTLGLLVIALRPRVENWRMAALAAAVLEGAVMVVFTEALSLVGALNASAMLALWVALGGFLAWSVWRERGLPMWDIRGRRGPPS
jgi:drug/metabolite transporter (DMT)-like permease